MAEIGSRRAEIFLIIEEIVSESFVFVNSMANLIRQMRPEHRRHSFRRIRYVMAEKIPKQIEHLASLISEKDLDCLEQLRMSRGAFARLCLLLKNVGGLVDSRYVSVNEKVAMFLSVLSHHKKNRVVKFAFKRSGQTISKHFQAVLQAVLKLHPILLMTTQPVDDSYNHSSWMCFQGCLGALDGTYIKVTVPESDKPWYRTRKGDIAVNVLRVCDQNMKFVYVLAGWEGSAADCRVLRDAVTRPNGFKVPEGHFFLCDNGYTNAKDFLAPYKCVRYHLDEWGEGRSAPQNYREFFNMQHSKSRNVIERSFGLLKKRWAILQSPSFYPLKTQNRIIMACTLLHNFLLNEMEVDPFDDGVEDVETIHDEDESPTFIETVEPSQEWSSWRDNLALQMWAEWGASRMQY